MRRAFSPPHTISQNDPDTSEGLLSRASASKDFTRRHEGAKARRRMPFFVSFVPSCLRVKTKTLGPHCNCPMICASWYQNRHSAFLRPILCLFLGPRRGLQLQQLAFPFQPEREPAQPVACDHPMARHRQQKPVGGTRSPHGTGGARSAHLPGNLLICDGLAEGNPPNRLPNAAAELGRGRKLQRQRGKRGLQLAQIGGSQICRRTRGKANRHDPLRLP